MTEFSMVFQHCHAHSFYSRQTSNQELKNIFLINDELWKHEWNFRRSNNNGNTKSTKNTCAIGQHTK